MGLEAIQTKWAQLFLSGLYQTEAEKKNTFSVGVAAGMGDSSSSGEEDGNAEWKAAIASVAQTNNGLTSTNNDVPTTKRTISTTPTHKDIKRYQLKVIFPL